MKEKKKGQKAEGLLKKGIITEMRKV